MLLLDYRMPDMDGLQFTRQFRRPLVKRDVPIVLISVVGDEPVRQAALDAGVIDFLVKPVRPRELRSRLRNLLLLRQQGESVKERARSLERQVLEGLREVEERERETLYRLARAIEYPRFRNGTAPDQNVPLRRADCRRVAFARRRSAHARTCRRRCMTSARSACRMRSC